MKITLFLMSIFVSAAALAGTYSDRQAALNQQSDGRVVANSQRDHAAHNQKYLRLLAGFISRHGGARGAIACQSSGARFRSRNEGVGSTVLSGSGLRVSLEYTAGDLKQIVHNMDSGRVLQVPIAPGPSSCTFDTRDGLGCESYLESADLPNDEFGNYVVVRCISGSYKKLNKRLGRLY